MTRYAGPTTEILLKRVRQTGGFATDEDLAVSLLSRCQRTINAGQKYVIASDTLTVPKQKLVFDYRSELPDAIDIVSVKVSTRRLFRADRLSDLAAYDYDWWRNITGTRLEAFCQVGRELLILYPGLASASSATVIYTKLTDELSDFEGNYDDALDLPDEHVNDALALSEILLLLSARDFKETEERINELIAAVTRNLHLKGVT